MEPKPIGIIGGAGPMAAVSLLEQIFSLARDAYGCWKDKDFPKVLVISFPFSDMLSENMDASLVRQELRSCLKKLREDGAAVIGIACNTLCAFLDEEEEARADLIRLPEIVREEVSPACLPLVLATSTSIRFNVFAKSFPCLYPEPKVQIEVDEIIVQILKGEQVLEKLKSFIASLQADVILLGCTELSLYARDLLNCGKTIIDPLKILANKLIKTSLEFSMSTIFVQNDEVKAGACL